MSKFLTKLIVEKVDDSDDEWLIVGDFKYQSDIGGTITVPSGYKTDFASIPQPFWIILPKDGKYDGAAVIHDYIYGTHKFDRKTCDQILLEAMKVLGVSWWKRSLIYSGVRLGGWTRY
jgi:hypothetical protein